MSGCLDTLTLGTVKCVVLDLFGVGVIDLFIVVVVLILTVHISNDYFLSGQQNNSNLRTYVFKSKLVCSKVNSCVQK